MLVFCQTLALEGKVSWSLWSSHFSPLSPLHLLPPRSLRRTTSVIKASRHSLGISQAWSFELVPRARPFRAEGYMSVRSERTRTRREKRRTHDGGTCFGIRIFLLRPLIKVDVVSSGSTNVDLVSEKESRGLSQVRFQKTSKDGRRTCRGRQILSPPCWRHI